MKFGHFDDAAKEYVITTPETPLPWINYLGSDAFFGLISNTGGGYCFYRDAKLRRLIRYRYNQAGGDLGGRFTYIVDDDVVWSPSFLPMGTPLDSYKCRHGMGYTIFESEKNGVKARQLLFVPKGERCEVQKLTLTNASDAVKSLKLYGAVEFCLWNAVDDSTNFQRNLNIGEVEICGSVIYHKTEYRERRNHYAFFSVNVPTDGFDTQREAFLGRFGTWQNPKMVIVEINAFLYKDDEIPNEASARMFADKGFLAKLDESGYKYELEAEASTSEQALGICICRMTAERFEDISGVADVLYDAAGSCKYPPVVSDEKYGAKNDIFRHHAAELGIAAKNDYDLAWLNVYVNTGPESLLKAELRPKAETIADAGEHYKLFAERGYIDGEFPTGESR